MGGARLVAVGILLSRVFGLVRQRVTAHFLGVGPAADALAAAFRIPILFVTDGFDAAYQRATEAAGDREILIAGGASTIRQAFTAGVLDEIYLDISPLLLGGGERLFDGSPRGIAIGAALPGAGAGHAVWRRA